MSFFTKAAKMVIEIDGSIGEGGGQVLRIALTLSALYGIDIKINNIRAGRPKPGLSPQHLKGVEIVKSMCNAKVSGATEGSTCLEFSPGPMINKKSFSADTKTAGCICLLAQVALPCALFAPSQEHIVLTLKGGTNVPFGPQIEYLTEVFKPYLNRFGADFDFTVLKRGYYPKGGGALELKVKPIKSLKAVTLLDPGEVTGINGWAFVAGTTYIDEAHGGVETASAAIKKALSDNNIPVPAIKIDCYREDRQICCGNASGMNIICRTTTDCIYGGSDLGSKKQTKNFGAEAGSQILKPILSRSCVDENMQDQAIILMALAEGTSRINFGQMKLSLHTETAIKIAEMMLGDRGLKFTMLEDKDDGVSNILECQGCGLVNSFYQG